MDEIQKSAQIALTENLMLKRNEKLLVVTDEHCFEIGNAFRVVGESICKECIMVQITPRKENGNEPPDAVAKFMKEFDVIVIPTSKSLSHTKARREACKRGVRIATLPGITKEVFSRTMRTDWQKLGQNTRSIAARISSAKEITIKTKVGTDFSFKTGGRKAHPDDGEINGKGAFGNLPAGEAYMAPKEGSASGKLVFDGSFPFVGILEEPFTVYVKDGIAYRIMEHKVKKKLTDIFSIYGKNARNIAEFGVGTLDTARISGNILEDEKVKGTIHIAFGDNASMGGRVQVPIHLDGIIKSPDVYLDGKLWMKKGVIL